MDFKVDDVFMGKGESELNLKAPRKVKVTAKVCARLDEKADASLINRPLSQKPYWHIERARLGLDSRQVKVELIRNGYPVASKIIKADGSMQDLAFETMVENSSWLALRIFPSSHTNPVFVLVDDKPIRASRRSAEWCLKSVNQCWSQKKKLIAQKEMQDAINAYEHARKTYRDILAQSKTK